MKKKKVIIGTIVVLLIILLGLFYFNPSKDDGIFEIGLIAPLTGDLAYFGSDFQNGAQIAIDEVHSAKVNFLVEDSQFSPKNAVSAYQKMNLNNDPNVVIVFGNGSDETVIPIAEENKDIVISTFSTASGFPSKSKYAFRYFTNADTDAPVIAEYAKDKLSLNKVAVLYVQDSFGIDYNNIFGNEFDKNGGEITGSEAIQYTENSYKTQITKLIDTNPDAIYIVAQDYQVINAIKEIRELGFTGKILTVGTIATNRSISQAGGLLEGVYTTAFCTDGTPKEFTDKYKSKYDAEPGFMAELGYDVVRIIMESSDGGHIQDANKIIKNMLNLKDFETNQGLVSSDGTGEIIIPVCPKVIRDNKIFNLVTNQYSNY